jgi:hypothetical protein
MWECNLARELQMEFVDCVERKICAGRFDDTNGRDGRADREIVRSDSQNGVITEEPTTIAYCIQIDRFAPHVPAIYCLAPLAGF